jgi:hypothetical protein
VHVVFASEHRAIVLLQGPGFERVGRIAVGERNVFPLLLEWKRVVLLKGFVCAALCKDYKQSQDATGTQSIEIFPESLARL